MEFVLIDDDGRGRGHDDGLGFTKESSEDTINKICVPLNHSKTDFLPLVHTLATSSYAMPAVFFLMSIKHQGSANQQLTPALECDTGRYGLWYPDRERKVLLNHSKTHMSGMPKPQMK